MARARCALHGSVPFSSPSRVASLIVVGCGGAGKSTSPILRAILCVINTWTCSLPQTNQVTLSRENDAFSLHLHCNGARWLLCIMFGTDKSLILVYALNAPCIFIYMYTTNMVCIDDNIVYNARDGVVGRVHISSLS